MWTGPRKFVSDKRMLVDPVSDIAEFTVFLKSYGNCYFLYQNLYFKMGHLGDVTE